MSWKALSRPAAPSYASVKVRRGNIVNTISATGKATITNMGAELGATTSMFPFDDRMATYLKATGRGDLVPFAERYPQSQKDKPKGEKWRNAMRKAREKAGLVVAAP